MALVVGTRRHPFDLSAGGFGDLSWTCAPKRRCSMSVRWHYRLDPVVWSVWPSEICGYTLGDLPALDEIRE